MFVLKNRNDPELSEANSHARLSHSKQLLKNIHPMTLTVTTPKKTQNDRLYTYPSTKKKDVATVGESQVVDITPV